jgi:hypothetical protein
MEHRVINDDSLLKLNGNSLKIILVCYYKQESRGSSVSIASGYGLDDRVIDVRSLAEAEEFFL